MGVTGRPAVALVTGANRGIGFETCRQLAAHDFDVVLGARDRVDGPRAARALTAEGLRVEYVHLDVDDPDSVRAAAALVRERFGRLDVLVNNAGIGFDFAERAVSADLESATRTIGTNVLGPWRVTQELLPLLVESPSGRVVNVSSSGGSFGATPGLRMRGSVAYSVSKAALNALTLKLATELAGTSVTVNAVCPGHTATAPGDTVGRPVPEGAASVVAVALLADDGPTGAFFQDGEPLPW